MGYTLSDYGKINSSHWFPSHLLDSKEILLVIEAILVVQLLKGMVTK